MDYTVNILAKISGVSVRTLHHYDAIGLLNPARIGDNNYRYYGREELLRLQQILFFRELGLSLRDIATVLDSDSFDTLRALRKHGEELKLRRKKLDELQRTVAQTIRHLQGEIAMNHDDLFNGFNEQNKEERRKALIEYYGEEAAPHIDESMERTKNWKSEDYHDHKQAMDDMNQRLVDQIEQGAAIDSAAVQDIAREYQEYVNQFWSADTAAFKALGTMYVENPDFRKMYDSLHPQLAEFLRDAIHHYCDNQ